MKRDLKVFQDFHQERLAQGQKVGVINLGCSRNLVDSQAILGRLKKNGHRIVDIGKADVAIVNTCSFIDEAKQESIDTICDLLELKKQGKLKKVIVSGCLAQRYGKELAQEFKELDAIIGTPAFAKDEIPEHYSLTPPHFAYVKICESCYNRCSFCAIPKIKGKFRSRTIESVLAEIVKLDRQGVKEINLIGQDITAYGMDLYHEFRLAKLLKEMTKVIQNIQWIRLLYAFPAHVTDELVEIIGQETKICNYIDMPLQHISDPILKAMNRNITTAQTRALVKKIRSRIPRGSLRTTFIVGLPGETEENFEELLEFVKTARFEKMGVFVYSQEEGTDAFSMSNQVKEAVKKQRRDILMKEQQRISSEVQKRFIGRTLKVIIEEGKVIIEEGKALTEEAQKGEEYTFIGRTEYDAPDVDGVIYVHSSKKMNPGDFVDVQVTDTLEYDMVAVAK